MHDIYKISYDRHGTTVSSLGQYEVSWSLAVAIVSCISHHHLCRRHIKRKACIFYFWLTVRIAYTTFIFVAVLFIGENWKWIIQA